MRTKRSMLNAIFSALSLLVSSIFSLFATREILLHLGSEYNGLNGTISQFLSVLMLVESGFTLAALVKLYKPFGDQDYIEINKILSKTKSTLSKMGLMMLVSGMAISAVYSMFIKTSVDYGTVLTLFAFSIISTAFNFAYTYRYRLLYQVSQTEYLIHAINVIHYAVMYTGMIFIVRLTKNIILARGYTMLCSIVAGLVIGAVGKRKFPQASFNVEYSDVQIEGTKDLLVSKITGMLYNSLTVFYIATFIGAAFTSVYAVYNSVISIITNYVHVVLSAPQNALGQVINHEKDRLKSILEEYEYIAILASTIFFSTTMVLLIPFIRLYTTNVNDVNYIVPAIAAIMVLTSLLQIIHIPSGQCIELSGNFRVVRNIQTFSCITLIVLSALGGTLYGFIGILAAKLATNVVLALFEIVYTHSKIAENTLARFMQLLFPNFGVAFILTFIEYRLLFEVNVNIFEFLLLGIVVLTINAAVILVFSKIFYNELLGKVINRFARILKKHSNKEQNM